MSAERSAGASATAADPSDGFDPDTFFCGDGPPSELGGTEAPRAAPSSAPVQSQWVGPVADLLTEGARAASDGRMPEALRLFTQAARKSPSCAAAHEQRAQVLLELDQYDEAVASAREACAADPRWGVGRLTLGRACLNAVVQHPQFATDLVATFDPTPVREAFLVNAEDAVALSGEGWLQDILMSSLDEMLEATLGTMRATKTVWKSFSATQKMLCSPDVIVRVGLCRGDVPFDDAEIMRRMRPSVEAARALGIY